MHWLLFDLAGPLASYGGVAPGPVRDTERVPSRAAILGLLAAALGIDRQDSARQRELGLGLFVAARVNGNVRLLRDYHTAQAPAQSALKGRPCVTRRDELSVPKDYLNTVLSERYYYTDYAATIGIVTLDPDRLTGLEAALRAPRFTLYLGRKSCPPAWPLDPRRLYADTWESALEAFDAQTAETLATFASFDVRRWLRNPDGQYTHGGDADMESHALPAQRREVIRRDEPLDTSRRLFADRRQWRLDQGSPT